MFHRLGLNSRGSSPWLSGCLILPNQPLSLLLGFPPGFGGLSTTLRGRFFQTSPLLSGCTLVLSGSSINYHTSLRTKWGQRGRSQLLDTESCALSSTTEPNNISQIVPSRVPTTTRNTLQQFVLMKQFCYQEQARYLQREHILENNWSLPQHTNSDLNISTARVARLQGIQTKLARWKLWRAGMHSRTHTHTAGYETWL